IFTSPSHCAGDSNWLTFQLLTRNHNSDIAVPVAVKSGWVAGHFWPLPRPLAITSLPGFAFSVAVIVPCAAVIQAVVVNTLRVEGSTGEPLTYPLSNGAMPSESSKQPS